MGEKDTILIFNMFVFLLRDLLCGLLLSVFDMDRASWNRIQDMQVGLILKIGYGLGGMKLGGHRGLGWYPGCVS